MRLFKSRPVRVLAIVLVLVMVAAGTLYAAGEQLQRSTIGGSGGSVTAANGSTVQSVIGASIGGSVIAGSSGLGLCSGFGCETRRDSGDDGGGGGGGGGSSSKKIYLPAVQK
jgi:hypothetical protein